jgi:hypothetical protein
MFAKDRPPRQTSRFDAPARSLRRETIRVSVVPAGRPLSDFYHHPKE